MKSGGIFKKEEQRSELYEESSGVLAVWGAPNSGKTTVAAKIAYYLSAKKKNVVLVMCDTTAPMLHCIVPPSELDVEKSLGSILAVPTVTENLVKFNMITIKRNPHLSIISMLMGENDYTYAPYGQSQVEKLIDILRDLAEYVIIDCSSYIANDILSAVALKEADDVLRLVKAAPHNYRHLISLKNFL